MRDSIEHFFEKIIFVIFRAEKPKFFRRKAKKSSIFGLDFFSVYKIFWLRTYFWNPLNRKWKGPLKLMLEKIEGFLITSFLGKFRWNFNSFFLQIRAFNTIYTVNMWYFKVLVIDFNFVQLWPNMVNDDQQWLSMINCDEL